MLSVVVFLLIAEREPALLNVPFPPAVARARQAEWGRFLGVPTIVENSLGMKFVLIPPGSFTMGPNGSTQRVTLRRPFFLATTETTLGQYRRWKPDHHIPEAAEACNTDACPTAFVSWEEAKAFCEWLSNQPAERAAGRVYSLPTNAQWEWAARAGTSGVRPFADESGKTDKGLIDFAWYNHTYTTNPKHETAERGRKPVAQKQPNAWGLYDIFGNVWEWCGDRVSDPATGEERQPLVRGGGWRSGGFHCSSVAHDPADPKTKQDHIGFRVACTIHK